MKTLCLIRNLPDEPILEAKIVKTIEDTFVQYYSSDIIKNFIPNDVFVDFLLILYDTTLTQFFDLMQNDITVSITSFIEAALRIRNAYSILNTQPENIDKEIIEHAQKLGKHLAELTGYQIEQNLDPIVESIFTVQQEFYNKNQIPTHHKKVRLQ